MLWFRCVLVVAVGGLVVVGQAGAVPAVDDDRIQLPAWPAPAVTLHVAPAGADDASGAPDDPFGSLVAARDRLRELRSGGGLALGGAVVVVHGGAYRCTEPFALETGDSGTAEAPIRYRAAEGERPVFTGGIELTNFTPVTDPGVLARLPESARDKVLQADLGRHGVSQLKPLVLGGFASGRGFTSHPVMELFFDGEAMPMSRWPNEGFVRMVDVAEKDGHSLHGLEGSKVGHFVYEGERPARWLEEQAPILYGYWFFDWADSYEPVAAIHPDRHEIELAAPYSRYGYRAGARWYALNLLSEIDMPGEWYLDREAGLLYFYPPSDPASATVELSVTDRPMVACEGVSHVAFEGLTWELGGVDAVILRGGANCLVRDCTVRRCGGNGIVVEQGTGHVVLGCTVSSMGRGGMVVGGGDRKTLSRGGHVVENCEIHTLSRIDHTYTPAVLASGVGNRIAHNELHHIPSSAIRLSGNDHLVELNEVHHVVQESDDQGGVDMWGNPTYRGNVIRHNYWHHIGNQEDPSSAPGCGRAGIRLDDAISGVRVQGNVFYKASAGQLGFGGVQIHGGKDNLIENNVFVDCMAAISFSAWGEARWRDFIKSALDHKDIDKALYLERYPDLARLADDADVNRVIRNLALGCGEFIRRDPGCLDTLENVVLDTTAGVTRAGTDPIDAGALAALLREHGLDPIPLEAMGRY